MNSHIRSHIYMSVAVLTVASASWYIHTISAQVDQELESVAMYQAHLEIPVGEPHEVSL